MRPRPGNVLTFLLRCRLSPMPNTLRHLAIATMGFCLALLCSAVPLSARPRTAAPAPTPTPAPQAESNKRIQDVKFFSKTLQREMPYRVVLPKDYFSSEIRY